MVILSIVIAIIRVALVGTGFWKTILLHVHTSNSSGISVHDLYEPQNLARPGRGVLLLLFFSLRLNLKTLPGLRKSPWRNVFLSRLFFDISAKIWRLEKLLEFENKGGESP